MLITKYKITILLFAAFQIFADPTLSATTDSNDLIFIKLTDVQPTEIDYIDYGSSAGNESSMFSIKEEITKQPTDCNVVATFHLLLQHLQYFSHLKENDQEIRKSFEENDYYGSGASILEYIQQNYTADYVDGIISVCIVKDKDGKEFVIFDKDNDEDFTNDEFLSYSSIYRHPFYNEAPQENNSLIAKADVDI